MTKVLSVQSVTKRFGAAARPAVVDVSLDVAPGELVALIGESGSGKSTLLRLIAGLELPSSGTIRINSKPVSDTRLFVPPEQRGVGMVFQDYALFPHLNVFKNIAFGLRGRPRNQVHNRVREVLNSVGLAGFEKRYPHMLSGGEQQRIALARAMAPEPAILLMDEPYSQLDTHIKSQVRNQMHRIFRDTGMTVFFVTHDALDALSLADRIAVLKEGRILQIGSPFDIYHRPRSLHVATFFGTVNMLPASLMKNGAREAFSRVSLPVAEAATASSAPLVCVRSENLQSDFANDQSTDYPCGIVKAVTFHGSHQELVIGLESSGGPMTEVTVCMNAALAVKVNERMVVKPCEPDRLTLSCPSSMEPSVVSPE